MEKCPRCSSPLERLSLADVTTVTCSNCGYADVPVEHEREFPDLESWRDAFNRFYDMVEESDTVSQATVREDASDPIDEDDGSAADESGDLETATETDAPTESTESDDEPGTVTGGENHTETETGNVADAAAER